MARPLSVVKINDPNDPDVLIYDLRESERFIYIGELLQNPNKAIVQEIDSGRVFITINASVFEEVSVGEY
jgi:hypothetical protein